MSPLLILLSLILTVTATETAINTTKTTTALPPTPPPLPPLEPQPTPTQEAHFNTILDAILNAGDFRNWANLLTSMNPSTIPFSATIFVPDNDAFLDAASASSKTLTFIDPLLFPYHIVPHRFTFEDLRLFPTGARLPTLLNGNTLVVTNNSAVNFTLDGAKVTRPDLFQNGAVCVHGVGGVLEYTLFGYDNDKVTLQTPSQAPVTEFEESEIEGNGLSGVPGVVQVSGGSRPSSSCSWVKVVVAVCVAVYFMRLVGFSGLVVKCGFGRSRVPCVYGDERCTSDVYNSGCEWKLVQLK